MNQAEVNGAVAAFLDGGDSRPWLQVLEAIRDGRVVAEARTNTLTIRAVVRPATIRLGQRLTVLRVEADMTCLELATLLEISISSVIRQMRGQVVGAWPGVAVMITVLGGDPAAFREDHAAAKAEHHRGRS